MKKKHLVTALVILGTLATFIRIDRFFFKKNHSFSLRYILNAQSKLLTSYPKDPLDSALLNQDYTYLDKGKQAFVFESADHQYVLKIYHFPSSLRKFPWLNHPKDYFFDFKNTYQKDVVKFHSCMASLANCYHHLREDCGLLGAHFGESLDVQKIHLIDRMGKHYYLSPSDLIFIIQKKAVVFFTALESALYSEDFNQVKHLVGDIIQVFCHCYSQGYEDRDSIIDKNYGVADNKVIIIDIGQILPLDSGITLKEYLIKKTDSVKSKLERDCPQLMNYYWDAIAKNS